MKTEEAISKTLMLLLFTLVFFSCNQELDDSFSHEHMQQYTASIQDSLITLRRDIHQHPELAGQEEQTAKLIENYLRDLGLEVKTDIAGYGIVGILKGGKKGKRIAWRADMDALPFNLKENKAFASKVEGVHHACGHDVHTAIALGIANVLAKYREDVYGTVYFIFQPSEETFKGAKAMISEGLFDVIQPQEIYATHVVPMQTGHVSVKPDEMFSYTRRLRINFKGDAPIHQLKKVVDKVHNKLQRFEQHTNPSNLNGVIDSETGIESPQTIYDDYLIFQGPFQGNAKQDTISFEATLNETDFENIKLIPKAVDSIINKTRYAKDLLSVEYVLQMPTVINDSKLTKQATRIIRKNYGAEAVKTLYGHIPYFNDDFAYFQQEVPGVYFFLGASDKEEGIFAMPHSPNFQVAENNINIGVQYFSTLLIERGKLSAKAKAP